MQIKAEIKNPREVKTSPYINETIRGITIVRPRRTRRLPVCLETIFNVSYLLW